MKKTLLLVVAIFGVNLSDLCGSPIPEIPKDFSLLSVDEIPVHPVSTNNKEAQNYFNQGLLYLYAFNQDASFWSFKKASELDPNLAMAYWGMAMALGTNINSSADADREKIAYELTQKAQRLVASATDNEKAYIEALTSRYSKNPVDMNQLDKKFAEAMKKVVEKFPDDLDAATLYAESLMNSTEDNLWRSDGSPGKETLQIVNVLESVLKRDPDHIGANHYYIHAIEASKHPERALMSAYRLDQFKLPIGHLLHMPAHIFLRLGDYHKSTLSNLRAAEADRAYMRQYGKQGLYPIHYYLHVMYFLMYSQLMEGRFEDAMRTEKEINEFYDPLFQKYKGAEFVMPALYFIPLRFHQWEVVLNQPSPPSQMLRTTAFWHFARAMAFAETNDLPHAYEEQNAFLKMKNQLPLKESFGVNTLESIYSIADLTLKAKLAEKQGDFSSAQRYLQQAINLEDKLSYSEPPDWILSPREMLGGMLLRDQQYTAAEKVFREELDHFPLGGRALFGLLESLKAQKQFEDAYWVQTAYEKAWQYSTPQSAQPTLQKNAPSYS